MRFIIEQPIIEPDSRGAYSIKLHASLESNPDVNYSIHQENITKSEIRFRLERNFEVLSRKIATHYLPYE